MTPTLQLLFARSGRGQRIVRLCPNNLDGQAPSGPVRSLALIVFLAAPLWIRSDASVEGAVGTAKEVAVKHDGSCWGIILPFGSPKNGLAQDKILLRKILEAGGVGIFMAIENT